MKLKATCLAMVLAIGATIGANGLSITPSSGVLNTTRYEGNQNDQPSIDAAIAPIIAPATELYKQNVGGSEEGPLAGSYSTVFANTPEDPADATITYVGGPIVGPTAWLLLKDGKEVPAWYLYNLTGLGWNGQDVLQLTSFWPSNGAISHVTLYGQTTTTVPDAGATVTLLGIALLSFAAISRLRFSRIERAA